MCVCKCVCVACDVYMRVYVCVYVAFVHVCVHVCVCTCTCVYKIVFMCNLCQSAHVYKNEVFFVESPSRTNVTSMTSDKIHPPIADNKKTSNDQLQNVTTKS